MMSKKNKEETKVVKVIEFKEDALIPHLMKIVKAKDVLPAKGTTDNWLLENLVQDLDECIAVEIPDSNYYMDEQTGELTIKNDNSADYHSGKIDAYEECAQKIRELMEEKDEKR